MQAQDIAKMQCEAIEARAKAHGVTMASVIKRAGLQYSTWWRWLKGHAEPRSSSIRKIEDALAQLIAAREARKR